MRLELTESVRKFINTLDESDLKKVIITEDALESDDESISKKVFEYAKARLNAAADRVDAINERLRVEHPEYFE